MREWHYNDRQLPYNPSDVDIRQQTFAIGHILSDIQNQEIELWRKEDYQRKSSSWDIKQRSRLIESLIMRIPLPIFYFDGSENPWKIIDGLHRLTSLYSFIVEDKWELKNLEFLKDFEGFRFSNLPFKYRRMIEQSTIQAYIINPGTPDRVKINIFQRINTGGTSLSRQEIRNAYYRGLPTEFINELSEAPIFLEATNRKISVNRMKDKEAVLRFFAFYRFKHNYEPPLEKFLDDSMEEINYLSEELGDIKIRFFESMNICKEIFEDKAFYILNVNGEKQSTSINIALFEAWSVNLAKLNSSDSIVNILNNKSSLINEFIQLLQNTEFHKSISSGRSSKKAVYTRFSEIERIIKKNINAY